MDQMKSKYSSIPAVILACLIVSLAEKSIAASFSDPTVLSGTWTSSSITLNSRGSNETKKILTLEFTEEGTITGTANWALLSGEGGDHVDTETDADTEYLIGSFNPHDGVFFLSETEENGFWQCRAITEDLLHCHKVQPGPKYVSTFVIFERKPR
jgi:hypothetical protein